MYHATILYRGDSQFKDDGYDLIMSHQPRKEPPEDIAIE